MNGEIQHNVSNVFLRDGETPAYGQLYVVDPQRAANALQSNPLMQRFNLRQALLNDLLAILKRTHPLSQAFNMLVELYDQQYALARQAGCDDVPRVQLTLLNESEIPAHVRDKSLHARQVNLPTCEEICALYVADDDNAPPERQGLHLSSRSRRPIEMGLFHRMTDAAHYPLLLPCGDPGYRFGIPKKNIPGRAAGNPPHADDSDEEMDAEFDVLNDGSPADNVSIAEFYRYYLSLRGDRDHFAVPYGQIFQEYLIDQSFKIDQRVYQYLRKKCMEGLLCTTSNAVRRCIQARLQRRYPGAALGYVLRLPATMIGSPLYYQQKFHDATHLFNQLGNPTFMITSTVNPNWAELKDLKMDGQQLADRLDLTNRVFFARIKKMREMVEGKDGRKGVFGEVKTYLDALEWQGRGPPHTHKLISVEDADDTGAYVDQYICAEIPPLPLQTDPPKFAQQKRKLRELVLKFQVHHHSATHCLDANGKCKRGFPKPYSNSTVVHDDRPTVYCRREPAYGGESAIVNGKTITNADIVSYNPAYMLIWEGHHNVEYCYGRQACKYAVKYHLKGGSYSYVMQEQAGTNPQVVNYDEPQGLVKCHYRGPHEAHARVFSQKIVRMSHSMLRLNVHLPGDAPLYFRRTDYERAQAAVLNDGVRLSRFEQFLKQCEEEQAQGISDIRKLLFAEVPRHFRWDKKENKWIKRVYNRKVLGRIYAVQPTELERFALYQLVLHRYGPTSFEALRTLSNGRVCQSFSEAAKELGLLKDDLVWERTLEEASLIHGPRSMRRLFAQILLSGYPIGDARALWEKFVDHMYDNRNIRGAADRETRKGIALLFLGFILARHWKELGDYHLPEPNQQVRARFASRNDPDDDFFFGGAPDDVDDGSDDPTFTGQPANPAGPVNAVGNRANYRVDPEYLALNAKQKEVVDMVFAAFDANVRDDTVPRLIFVSGAGGVGKTYVYKTLVELCLRYRIRALVTATTGVAATLLPMGSTLHSAFRLPLDRLSVQRGSTVPVGSTLGRRIAKTQLLIVDEVTMLRKEYLSIVDNICRDQVLSLDGRANIPFAGKVVILGGDWRQLLPVVPGESLIAQVNACVKTSPLYAKFRSVVLTENMRVLPNQVAFLDLLERVGKDAGPTPGTFRVPDAMRVNSLAELINFVYDNGSVLTDMVRLRQCLLLALKRVDVQALNDQILAMINEPVVEYLSSDESLIDNPLDIYAAIHDVANLNKVDVSQMPPHVLHLKKGAIVVLLRNVDVYNGLGNGTRLEVLNLGRHFIDCRIVAGPHAGREFPLNRFLFQYEDKRADGNGIRMTRFQLPVSLAFAMTVNKAQGQSAERLGLYLEDQVFSHGQLYVALSRASSADGVRVYVQGADDPILPLDIHNIVIKNIL